MVKSKRKFSTVSLSSTFQDERIISIAKQCLEVLKGQGVKVLIDPNLSKLKSKKISLSNEKEIIKESELLIAIGGDGTMLNCSRKYGSKGIPVLGINLGNLGFLTDINPKELSSSLIEVAQGNYKEDERFFLEVMIQRSGKRLLALNEVVIHSGEIAQLIEFDLSINNSFVYRQKADGLILSSPTGSTAYSLSGGGPIIHPEVQAISVIPMYPHSLASSPFVINADSCIKVEIKDKSKKSQLCLDGSVTINIKNNEEIIVSKSNEVLNLIHPLGHDFFNACRNKLGWGLGISGR